MKQRGPGSIRLLRGGICLALCLTLCGCGVRTAPVRARNPTPAPVSIPGQAADWPEYETALTVDGREIPAWEYLYWLTLACDRARGAVPDWDAVREQALMNTALYASVETLAARYSVTLDAADADAVSNRWRRRCEAYGGEAEYLKEIARYGLDRTRAETLFRVGLLYGKLRALCAADSDFSPDDAELNAFASESGAIQIDRILVTDSDRAAARRRAETFFSQLNSAADQGAVFSELTWEGSDHDGPRPLRDGTFNERLTQVARALQIGQLSGIIESDDGFSILRRLPPDRESLLDTWLRRVIEDAARTADMELSERCLRLDLSDFSAALEKLRQNA